MKSLMQMYVHALNDETEAFWDYIELLKHETHKERKNLWYAIASDELQHYAKIKDAIWEKDEEHSEMEVAFYHEMHGEYEKMKKCLEKYK